MGHTVFLLIPFQIKEQIYVAATLEIIPVAARSKAWVSGGSLQGLRLRIPPGALIYVRCECCVLSGSGLCDGTTNRLEESYRMWCVWMLSWSLDPLAGCCTMEWNALDLFSHAHGSKPGVVTGCLHRLFVDFFDLYLKISAYNFCAGHDKIPPIVNSHLYVLFDSVVFCIRMSVMKMLLFIITSLLALPLCR